MPINGDGFNLNSDGSLKVQLQSSTGLELYVGGVNADSMASSYSVAAMGQTFVYNGTNWDRARGNTQGTLLASAARTTSQTSGVQTNYNARGCIMVLNVTAVSGTGGLKVSFQASAQSSGAFFQMNADPTTVTAVGKYSYVLYPGIGSPVGQVTQTTNMVLPRSWYGYVSHVDSSSYTYQLEYLLIL